MTFTELGLNPDILKAIEEQGYTQPTPIQEQAIPIVLDKHDFSYMCEGTDIHKYSNSFDGKSVSLHLYTGAVDKWKSYNPETDSWNNKLVLYDTVNGEKIEQFK